MSQFKSYSKASNGSSPYTTVQQQSNSSSASNNNANSRQVETMLLEKSHGTSPEAQIQISKILNDRYSFAGSQKPFLVLEGTEMRQDVKEEMQEKVREAKKKELAKKEMLNKTLKTSRKSGIVDGSGKVKKIPNTKGKAKIRHSKLEHARNGLKEYIQKCQKAQAKLEEQLRQHERNAGKNGPSTKNSDSQDQDQLISLDPNLLQYRYHIPVIGQFLELNKLWEGYMQELLFNNVSDPSQNNQQNNDTNSMTLAHKLSLAGKLASADFHGAKLKVVSAHNPSLVGFEGIVIWEAKSSFILVVAQKTTPHATIREKIGGLRIVEKRGTVFSFQVRVEGKEKEKETGGSSALKGEEDEFMTFEIVGSRFMYRTAERSGKKFKSRSVEDLM